MGRRRKRGRSGLPKGLYSWEKAGRTYWKIGKTLNGKRIWIQLGAMTEPEALEAFYAFQLDPEKKSSPSAPSTGLAEFLMTEYLPWVKDHLSAGTLEMETERSEWLNTYFGNRDLRDIDTEAAEEYKRWRRDRGGRRGAKGERRLPTKGTINMELRVLRKAMKHAATLGIIRRPPTIVSYPEHRKEARWLNAAEIDAVIAAATPRRRLLLLFAFHTGMRPGEIASRHRDDIHLGDGYIRVASREWEAGGKKHTYTVKRRRTRTVPISPALHDALSAAWDDLPEQGPIFAGQSLAETLKRCCNNAGVERIPPYGTRHSFISRWLQEGRSRDALIKIVGHADGKMIDKVYAHFGTPELASHMGRVTWGREGEVIDFPVKKTTWSGRLRFAQ